MHCIKSVLFLLLCGISLPSVALKQDPEKVRLSSTFFSGFIEQKATQLPSVTNISELAKILDGRAEQVVLNIAVIEKNMDVLTDGVEHEKFNHVIGYLLQYDEPRLVLDILQELEDYGDTLGSSKIYFNIAKYYEARGDWRAVLKHLEYIDPSALKKVNNDYALLMQGVALQALKKHRQAAKVYERVGDSSPYFAHAKLNRAIAYLRQGWWTEGHIEITAGLASLERGGDPELYNRMRNTLAYSQMREGFYRDARETFRDIELESIHANKGLIGLGLCATYQKDFVGALNAFAVLKKRPVKDLSVDESYLLVPFIYEQLGQLSTASVAYADAVTYFESRILALKNRKRQYENASLSQLLALAQDYTANKNALYGLKDEVPSYLYQRLRLVAQMQENNVISSLGAEIQTLVDEVSNELVKRAADSLDMRLEMLGSYSGQAKYGIAKLYDE